MSILLQLLISSVTSGAFKFDMVTMSKVAYCQLVLSVAEGLPIGYFLTFGALDCSLYKNIQTVIHYVHC